MTKKLKILHLDDLPGEAVLINRVLKKGKIDCEYLLVDTKEAYLSALQEFNPDVILSDPALLSFEACDALTILQETGLKIPFILVTAIVNEASAVDALKRGAEDYILKDRPDRLPFAIQNALEKHRLKQTKEVIIDELICSQVHLNEAQSLAKVGSWETDLKTFQVKWSNEMHHLFGTDPTNFEPSYLPIQRFVHPEDREMIDKIFMNSLNKNGSNCIEHRINTLQGIEKWIEENWTITRDEKGLPIIAVGTCQDITQSKNAAEKVIRSEAKLKVAQRIAHVGSWEVDLSEGIITWSEEALKIFGLPLSENRQSCQSWINFIHPDDRAYVQQVTKQAKLTNSNPDYYTRIIRKDGTVRHIHTQTQVELDPEGKPVFLYGVYQDVTEIKESEEFLKISQGNLTAIIENTEATIYSLDKNLRYITFNHRQQTTLKEAYGLDIKVGDHVFDFLKSLDANEAREWQQVYDKALKGEIVKVEKEFTLDNTYLCIRFSIHPIWEDQRVIGLSCYTLDISENKIAENKVIATSKELNKALLDINKIMDSSVDIICSMDEDGRFVTISAACERVWGYKPEELIGRKYMDLVYGEHIESTRIVNAEIRDGQPVSMFENKYVHKDGRIIPMLWSSRWDEKDQIFYSIAKDITGKKTLEKAVEAERDQFFDMFSSAPSAIGMLKGAEHVFEIANPLYLQLIGKKDVIGKTVAAVLPEIIEQGFMGMLDNVYRTGETYIGTGTLVKVDTEGNGELTEFYINSVYQAHRNVKGEIDGIFFFINDITEQILSRKNIEKSEKFFKGVIENSDDMLTMIDHTGKTIYASPAVSRKFGYTPAECLNFVIPELIHPDDAVKMQAFLIQIMKHPGVPMECPTIREIKKDGSYIWVEGTLTNFLETEGINAIVANFRDITEKKKLEGLLEKTNRLAAIGSWEIDVAKGTVFWSEVTKEIREVDKDYVPHLDVGISYFKEGRHKETISQKIQECKENGTPWDEELQIITFKGNHKWVRTIGEGEFLNGKCIMIYGSFQDIDARKKAEIEVLKVYEEKNVILESIGDGFYAVDKNWNFTYWNKKAEILLRKKREDVLGKNIWEIYPDAFDTSTYENYHKSVEQNVVKRYERFNVFLDRWFEINTYPSTSGLSVYFSDITERKLAEQQIKADKTLLRTLIDHLPDTIYYKDKAAKKLISNKFDYTILGADTEEEVLGKTDLEISSHANSSMTYAQDMEILNTGKPLINFEEYFTTADSKPLWLLTSKLPLRNEDNEIIGLLGIGRDITQRKFAKEELLELNAALEKNIKQLVISNAELEQFAYVASHDLQEPLRMITSFLTLLEKKYKGIIDDKGQQYIDFAVDGGLRMRQIILDLLEFSRVGRTEDRLEKVDLNELVNDILSLHSRQIQEVNAIIKVGKLPFHSTYKTPMRQVFQNLINNSLKYHREGITPQISISVSSAGNFWQFAVTDNGIGIPQEYLDKIFIIFQRLHNKEKYSGTGIGLSITKKIIDNLGGSIRVESAEGEGSTFYFKLPKELQ